MAGYSKLFSSIVTSSIWCEDNITLRVWIAMLATCDASGVVEGSVPGFASLARVSPAEMRKALDTLMSPDEDSRTPDNEGRRVAVIPGGWQILNYSIYRERLQGKAGSNAEHQRAYRERKAQDNALSGVITHDNEGSPVSGPASASASAYPGGTNTLVVATPFDSKKGVA